MKWNEGIKVKEMKYEQLINGNDWELRIERLWKSQFLRLGIVIAQGLWTSYDYEPLTYGQGLLNR